MSNFENLPIGAVVAVRNWEKTSHETMTIVGFDNPPGEGLRGYRMKELKRTPYILPTKYIERVISYPIDRDKLRPGVKVKVRDDLKKGVWYGDSLINDDGEMDKWLGKTVTLSSRYKDCWMIKEDDRFWSWTVEMFECEIEKPQTVDGIDALVAMKSGKFVKSDSNGYIYKLEDNVLMTTNEGEREPWKFKKSDRKFKSWLLGRYEILDELPEWAHEPKNPFKVGDIVVDNVPIEVIELLDAERFKAKMSNDFRIGERFSRYYRLATETEQIEFWRKRAKYLEGDKS